MGRCEHEARDAVNCQRAKKEEERGERDRVPKEWGKKEGQPRNQQNGKKKGENRGKGGNKAWDGRQDVPDRRIAEKEEE